VRSALSDYARDNARKEKFTMALGSIGCTPLTNQPLTCAQPQHLRVFGSQNWDRPLTGIRPGQTIRFVLPNEILQRVAAENGIVTQYQGIPLWNGRLGYQVDGGEAKYIDFAEGANGGRVDNSVSELDLVVPEGRSEIQFWIELTGQSGQKKTTLPSNHTWRATY
jgi:hypothetical protein